MSSYIAKNDYLSQSEMETNARYIWAYLKGKGWTIQAVASTLANMQVESTINPAIYEGLNSDSNTNGFGLVQWTPNTKYKTWADSNGYTYEDMDGQLARIIYELDNGLQWISTDSYPMTFEEYTKSTGDVGELAYTFMYNYERPASLDQPARKEYAKSWLAFLNGVDVTPDDPTPDGTDKKDRRTMSRLLFYYAGIKRY